MSAVLQHEPAPFRDVDAALKFYCSEAFEAYERSALAQMQAGPRPPGKGLGGLEGAATRGIIGANLATIPQLWRRILLARYAPRSDDCPACEQPIVHPAWKAEIEWLAESVMAELSAQMSNRRLRQGIVARYFGNRAIKLGALADFCHVHRNTASDHAGRIIGMLRREEKSAYSAMDERLRSAGLVE